MNAAGTVKVDWGDGTLSEQTAAGAYDGWDNGLEFTGTPSGIVKIYGEGVNYFQAFTKYTDDAIVGGITSVDLSNATAITELDLHQNSLSSVDLSKLTALTSLMIGVNEFESIDLSANTELTMLDISDGKNAGKLTSIDLSNNTKLTKVVLSGNKLSVLDLSKNPLVKTLTVLNNELASVTFGENTTSKHTINLGGNKLTSVDLSGFTTYSGTYLRVRDNELKEIVLPGKIGQIWADGNAFTLSQLYALKSPVRLCLASLLRCSHGRPATAWLSLKVLTIPQRTVCSRSWLPRRIFIARCPMLNSLYLPLRNPLRPHR